MASGQGQGDDADQKAQTPAGEYPWSNVGMQELFQMGRRSGSRLGIRGRRACIDPAGQAGIVTLANDRLIAKRHQIPLPGDQPLMHYWVVSMKGFQQDLAGGLPGLQMFDAAFQTRDPGLEVLYITPRRNQQRRGHQTKAPKHEAPSRVDRHAAG